MWAWRFLYRKFHQQIQLLNSYSAIQIIDFFLVELVVYIFYIICLFDLICLIYWYMQFIILFYYPLNICRLCSDITSF